ncbi:TfoX/Sxy family protein [Streptomyces sp. SL13]|uniref:TfoX/Sxy family protein n=1 Tax=Streptantibioticus silvisoli TaxID=2705255 RepID=A0AA90H412_9ACTN|nr:TfoX/Sxy family protein [Streptantibioticus silvisoli]MDI5965632.1 TfoX/Sxy family protein [Streptantibioticus silvisoli]MDI5971571.1 TfoX/Sxy family protein [Streptantibioticus silvisoli]
MAYDERLAGRVRERIAGHRGVTERVEVTGLAFYHDGNLAVSVLADALVVRVGPTEADAALARPGAAPFVDEGHTMRGWIMVDVDALVDDVVLYDWVDEAHAYAASLPEG